MNTTPSSPDPPPTPQLQSMFPAHSSQYPTDTAEMSVDDWIWYHPGLIRGLLSFSDSYYCRKCDVTAKFDPQMKPNRCWNCGKFAAHYYTATGRGQYV